MEVIRWDKFEGVIKTNVSDHQQAKSFCFDVDMLPLKSPRKLVIMNRGIRYEMAWRKFLRQTTIGTFALIDKSQFTIARKPRRPANSAPR